MEKFKIEGLVPAVFTPFKEDGSVNFDMIYPYAEHLVKAGAFGVFVCGSTGESASMTVEERKAILETWVKAVDGRCRIIAHVGGTCLADCVELAKHAASLKVDAVGAIAPYYAKPSCTGDLINFYKPIGEAIAPIPLYAYHIPSMSGINLPQVPFLKAAGKEIPNFNGIKFTSNNFMEMMECINCEGGRFDILNGFDEMLLCGMAVGAKGGVGSTYNYCLEYYTGIMDCFLAGDIEGARVWQQKSIDIVNVIIRHGGGIRGGKAIMKLIGIDCGNCRVPVTPYSKDELDTLRSELDEIGFQTH
ncbi:MAG: dihydrodipicolinate synthase family protein [Bacteroidales bacterium]|nr:dihydrodipicolinate synthase family protein [Bacteroidales bacterium]